MFRRLAYAGVLLGIAVLAGWGCSQNPSKEDSGTKDNGAAADKGGAAGDADVSQREGRLSRPIGKVLRRINEGPGPDDEAFPRAGKVKKGFEKRERVPFPDQPKMIDEF